MAPHVWLRAESKLHERRTPLVPTDAARLKKAGFEVTVESSRDRIFADDDYARAGCTIVPAHTWTNAPDDAWILGLKELPTTPTSLRHRHVYFGHAFKQQAGALELLARFARGRGELWDLEFLTDDNGRRLSAFGHWAGFAGAALSADLWAARVLSEQPTTFSPAKGWTGTSLVDAIRPRVERALQKSGSTQVLVLGALGRSGRGAVECLEKCGFASNLLRWDLAETRDRQAFPEIPASDIVMNCILLNGSMPPFLRTQDLTDPKRRLRVLGDVSCDPTSPYNPFPFASRTTEFDAPAYRVAETPVPLEVIAVDHLPSLLPAESSTDFSTQLTPWLEKLHQEAGPWMRARQLFVQSLQGVSV